MLFHLFKQSIIFKIKIPKFKINVNTTFQIKNMSPSAVKTVWRTGQTKSDLTAPFYLRMGKNPVPETLYQFLF